MVSAELYQSKKSNPYIVLFHADNSCKGEFDSIVSRFIKMNNNCLAVDLRSGDDLGFLKNETANRAKEEGYANSLARASLDMNAAINYAFQLSTKKVSIYGSESSASLALIVGKENENVKAIVAFSPGEYFEPEYQLKSILANYPKPVFVGCTSSEYLYFSDIEGFPGTDRILFKPGSGEGLRGTHALLRENSSRDEYWLSLLIFFKSLQ
jgi:dienelactone hydrolase